jgi:transposase-like protein
METYPVAATYKNHRFPVEIVSHAVWLYFRFCLSFRDWVTDKSGEGEFSLPGTLCPPLS